MSSDASFAARNHGSEDESPREPPADGYSDAQLMMRISAGEATALGELMETHWPSLVRYATTLIGCLDTAEDVAQAVFVHVWENRSEWTHTGSAAGYLFRIARNLSIGIVRREEVRIRHRPRVRRLQTRPSSPLQACQDGEFANALEEALRSLPERRREAFELVRFQGLSLAAAAEVMDVSRRTVANHLYLAALDLAKRLSHFW